ncbi:hypothetical protein TI39_contig632g00001 [Zymoseptoria brevis]|uniref:Methyltransferase domain-containing protein n=1 Tax=Zymoseptoria brevis TaxID=1047168 RepID=A0A0F4GG42_9PEZI|nr:hypothetical protein TI39_contig632g00001 [Zymoseptoria brevis]
MRLLSSMGNCASTPRCPPAGKQFDDYDNDDDDVYSIEKSPRFMTTPDQSTAPTAIFAGPISPNLHSQCAYLLPTLSLLTSEKPTLQILDIGSGTGHLIIELALSLPSAQVIGTDACSAILSSARTFASYAGADNLTFQTADAHSLPFPDNSFDLVHTHQALAHFHSPVLAIKEMLRVTRPGGKICIREGDLKTARFWPEDEVLKECFDVIREVHGLDGGTVDAGMRLGGWVREAGVRAGRVGRSCSAGWVETERERREYGGHWPGRCGGGVFREAAMEMGIGSNRLDEYALAWRRWMENPEGAFSMMHGEVIISV